VAMLGPSELATLATHFPNYAQGGSQGNQSVEGAPVPVVLWQYAANEPYSPAHPTAIMDLDYAFSAEALSYMCKIPG
jgi:hypothetical protein